MENRMKRPQSIEPWPQLPLQAWQGTFETLQLWLQMAGKVRLKQSPLLNHWWQTPFYVTARGLTTSTIFYDERAFEIRFDFIDHELQLETSDGQVKSIPLVSTPLPLFYSQFMNLLKSAEIDVRIWPVSVETAAPIRFTDHAAHSAYDPQYANRFWRVLLQSVRIFEHFRARFLGKCSPPHFFWGAGDLAMTRFSGRLAPKHAPAPNVAHYVVLEAYSHEVSSCGFWPGGGPVPEPFYYSYAYPEPPGYRDYALQVPGAFYSTELGEFILPYELVRTDKDPDGKLLSFLQATYEAAAQTGRWDRHNLERLQTR